MVNIERSFCRSADVTPCTFAFAQSIKRFGIPLRDVVARHDMCDGPPLLVGSVIRKLAGTDFIVVSLTILYVTRKNFLSVLLVVNISFLLVGSLVFVHVSLA